MKKLRHIALGVLLLSLLWPAGCLIRYSGRDQCGIAGNRVAVNAPFFLTRLVNGAPDEVDTLAGSGEKVYRYHNKTLFGKARSSIGYRGGFRLWQIEASIPVEGGEKDALFEAVSNSLRSRYQNIRGFYCEDISDENGIPVGRKMGSNLGPPFLLAEIRIDEASLSITVSDLR